jgi:hypothetical protein
VQLDGKSKRRSDLDTTFVVLAGIAWATGLLYLVVRANLPSPVRLVIVDGLHIYVGIASIVFVIGILATEAPIGTFETGRVVRQTRWLLSGLYLVLYGAGALLALPPSGPMRAFLVDLHLLAAVWTVVPTGWYLMQDRSATLRYAFASRSRVALLIILIPAVLVAIIAPRMIAPLTLTGAGAAWRGQGFPQRFIDRMAMSPNGDALIAGGEGLYVRRPNDQRWQQVAFPPELVLSVALSRGPTTAYVGTTHGIYESNQLSGPYRRLPFPSFEVHGIAVDPQDPSVIWASSRGGVWRSADAGRDWIPESAGIRNPAGAWAIAFFGGALFASDSEAVYRWNGARWIQSASQRSVVALDPSADRRRLFASSMAQGIESFDGHTWTKSDAGLAGHGGGGAIHVVAVTDTTRSHAYAATMLDGVAVSTDGGRNWSPLRAGLPPGSVWRVLEVGHSLLAATDNGIYAYPLDLSPPPGPGWWLLLIGLSLAGALGASLALHRPRGRRY